MKRPNQQFSPLAQSDSVALLFSPYSSIQVIFFWVLLIFLYIILSLVYITTYFDKFYQYFSPKGLNDKRIESPIGKKIGKE
jgi:hypothetical protein